MSGLFEKGDSLNTPIECFVLMRCGDRSYILNKGEMIIFHPSAVHLIYPVDSAWPVYDVLKFNINRFNLIPTYAPKLKSIFQYAEKMGFKNFIKSQNQ